MLNKKLTDTLPSLSNDTLTDVWGGANRQAAIAERERIKEMKRPFVRTNPGLDRVVKG
jgi:hypothetical protein